MTLPGSGRKVGTVSIVQPKPQEVRDDAAMLEWAREHRPDWVKTIEHPPMPAWTEERVDWARVLDGVQDTEAGVVTDDGEPVRDCPTGRSRPRRSPCAWRRAVGTR